MNQEDDYLWDRRHRLIYHAELSALYHRKRERYYDGLDKLTKAIAVMGGSAALANLGGPGAVQVAAVLITLTSTLALVFGFAAKARLHSDLAGRFVALISRIHAQGERDSTETDLAQGFAQLHDLEASEPPTLTALVLLCQNQLASAADQPDRIRPLGWWARATAHWLDHPSAATVK